jgi:hypothetical protein
MGYTHYWYYQPNKIEDKPLLREKFGQASKQIQEFADYIDRNKMFSVCNGLGEEKPTFNNNEVWFNGDKAEGLDHETFCIEWDTEDRDFCKTARKPYDLLVCFSLLTFSEVFPREIFSFSSDGTPSEPLWQNAIKYYEKFTGKKASFL